MLATPQFQPRLSSITNVALGRSANQVAYQCCSRQISQSGCSIHIKLNYTEMYTTTGIHFDQWFTLS